MVPGLEQNKAVHRTATTDQDSGTILVTLIGRYVLRQPLSPETYLGAGLMSGIEKGPRKIILDLDLHTPIRWIVRWSHN